MPHFDAPPKSFAVRSATRRCGCWNRRFYEFDGGSTGFRAAKSKAEQNGAWLGLLERQRVKMWLRNACEQIDGLGV